MKHIARILYWLFIILLVVIAGMTFMSFTSAPQGYRVFSVQSGSMEPQIQTGSIVVVKPQGSYQKDDIITYLAGSSMSTRQEGSTITHRLVDTIEDANGDTFFITKGDANEESDPNPVAPQQVVGAVLFSIPYIGRAISFAQTEVGFIFLVVVPGTLIIYGELQNIKNEVQKFAAERRKKRETA